jgi:hypothetical protein
VKQVSNATTLGLCTMIHAAAFVFYLGFQSRKPGKSVYLA